MRKPIICGILCLLAAACPALAQQGGIAAPEFDPTKPLQIDAERLEADGGDRMVRFEGNVIAKQGDATLGCDVLLIYFQQQPTTENEGASSKEFGGKVERFIALGRVQLVQDDRRATCDRAEYNHVKETIALTGSPMVKQGDNLLRGSTILIHVPNQRVQILGGKSGRVSVTINPGTIDNQRQKSPE